MIAPLTGSVVTLESEAAMSAAATTYIAELHLLDKVAVVTGALGEGYAPRAPYDRIVVCGAIERGLETLFDQIAPSGSLLTIETRDSRRAGKAVRYDKIGTGISVRALFDATVPVLPAFRKYESFVF